MVIGGWLPQYITSPCRLQQGRAVCPRQGLPCNSARIGPRDERRTILQHIGCLPERMRHLLPDIICLFCQRGVSAAFCLWGSLVVSVPSRKNWAALLFAPAVPAGPFA